MSAIPSYPGMYAPRPRKSLNDGILGYPQIGAANTAPNIGTMPDPRAIPNAPSFLAPGGSYDGASAPLSSGYQHVSAPYLHNYGRPAAPSARSDDYMPPGFSAPAPAYSDAMNRVDEAATDRTRRSNNFYDSVQRNNGRMPTAPTYLITGAGRSAPGIVPLPPGSNVLGPAAPSAAPKPSPAPKGYSQQEYIANPNFDESQPVSTTNQKYTLAHRTKTIATPEQTAAGNQAGASMFVNTPSTNGQPAQPAQPEQQPLQPGEYGTKKTMQLTEQQAQSMWEVMRQQNPQADEQSLHHQFVGKLALEYGIPPQQADALRGRWSDKGLPQAPQQVQQQPGLRVPLSMLGSDSSGGTSSRYVGPKESTAGPAFQSPGGPAQVATSAVPGATPISREGPNAGALDHQTAAAILNEAGGNNTKARAIARQRGYVIPT